MILNSPYISGSLTVTGNIITSGSITISGSIASASYAVSASEASTLQGLGSASFAPASTFNTVSQSYAASSASLSTRVTNEEATSSVLTSASASFATTSGSISSRVTLIEGQYATTGSNTFTGPQYVSQASNAISFTSTASLYTDGGLRVAKDSFVSGTAYFNNITVYGTSSIEYITSSQVNIGSNIITVNTDTPAVRFGGLSVFDSGSTQLTGSIFWDSEKNNWIYSNPSGSTYNSGMLISGPRNSGSLGDEQGTTNNALMKGQGGDHITSSQVIDDGTTVRIPGALQVTGSTILASALTGTSATFSDSSTLLTLSSGAGTKAVFATTRNFGVNRNFQIAVDEFAESAFTITPSTTLGGSSYTTPIFTLAAAGTATFSSSVTAATLIFKDATNSNSYGFRGLSGIVTLDAGSVYPTGWNFQYGGGASSALYINGSGNVGIKTSGPVASLDVSSDNFGTPYAGTSSTYVGMMRIGYTDHSWGGGELNFGVINSAGANYMPWIQAQIPQGGTSARPLGLNPNGGNVLIGTTTDVGSGWKLQVNGSGYFTNTNSVGYTYLTISNSGASGRSYDIGVGGNGVGSPYQNSFYVYDNIAGQPRFYIASTGAATFSSSITANSNSTINGSGVDVLRVNTSGATNTVQFTSTGGAASRLISILSKVEENSCNIDFRTHGSTYGPETLFSNSATNAVMVLAQPAGGAVFCIGNYNNGDMVLGTSNTERVRITSGGAINFNNASIYTGAGCVNTTVSTTNDFCFSGLNTNATNPRGLYLRNSATTAGDYAIYYEASGAARFYVIGTGDVKNTNNSYGAISDIRLKENITDATPKLDDLLKVKIKNFNLISDELKTKQIGVIAQELEEIFPSMITEDKLIGSNETIKTVKYSVFVPMLIKAIQEQQTQIQALKARIETLEK